MTLSVRDAAPGEHPALLQLVLAAYGAIGFLASDPGFEEEVAGLMESPNTQVIVAEIDGAPVGTITLYPDGRFYDDATILSDWSCLRTLAVSPAAQGRGAGRALMTECLSRARALGRSRMLLHTHESMKAAIRLHESLGFVRAPDLDLYYTPELTFIAYVLDL